MTHIYQDLLARVQKPARYIGNEWNVIRKPWESVAVRVALAFPDTYEIGMSHLGMRILYALLNGREEMLAERCYCPWPDMEQEIRAARLPLVSMESQRPLREFDVVGFSLQFEMEYTNVLTMLDLGGIPLRSSERTIADPLIIGGGSCAFSPEPVADFFDCFLIGDGEAAFPAVITRFHQLRAAGLSREAVLRELAHCDGIYVPSAYRTRYDVENDFVIVAGSDHGAPLPVKRTMIADLSDYPFPTDVLVPNTEIVHDRVSFEIARGCTEGCRFCQAGTIYRPVRERKPTEIVNAIKESLEKTGYDGVSLTSLSTADYSCMSPMLQSLMTELEPQNTSVSVSSLRVYGLTETMADEISKVRKTGFTIAPEAGSQRLREVINKGISEEEILHGARTAFKKGWNRIKLYFMIGLPTETADDLRGIVDLALEMIRIGREEFRRNVGVTVSVSTLIPKPQSPFQWCAFNDRDVVREKHGFLKSLIRPHRQIEFRSHHADTSYVEAIFARGDRRLSDVIEHAWRAGARFDAWTEWFKIGFWEQALAACALESAALRWLGEIPLTADLPWDHIDPLVEKRFQLRELKRAMKNRFSPACEKPFKKYGMDRVDLADPSKDTGKPYVCYDCGLGCDLEAIKAERQHAWTEIQEMKTALRAQRVANHSDEEPTTVTYRGCYQKLGEFRYLSALDLTKTLTRAFNRAQVPLKFSAGFHPMPAISYGPALPLGIEGREEWLDFVACLDLDAPQMMARINAHLPHKMRFTEMVRVHAKVIPLFQKIDTAIYTVDLSGEMLRQTVQRLVDDPTVSDAERHEQLVARVLARDTIFATVQRKGKPRSLDLRPLIKRLAVENGTCPLSLRMVVGAGAKGNLRPELLLKAIYQLDNVVDVPVTREGLYVDYNGRFRRPHEPEPGGNVLR